MSSSSLKLLFALIFFKVVSCYSIPIKESEISLSNSTDVEDTFSRSILYSAIFPLSSPSISNHSTRSSEPEISTSASYSTYLESKTQPPDFKATDSVPKFSAATFYTRDSSISDYHTTKNKQKLTATTYDTRNPERRYRSKFYTKNSELSSSASVYYITSESTSNSSINKKDVSMFSCSLITIEHGEYIILSNDTLFIEIPDLALSSSFYIQDGDSVAFCESGVMDEAKEEEYWKTAHSLLPLCITEIVLIVVSLSLRILQ